MILPFDKRSPQENYQGQLLKKGPMLKLSKDYGTNGFGMAENNGDDALAESDFTSAF